ncbi:hypothetical protein LIER_05909 [Lithospermum erythrorhizon]|uniref:LanC-like protein GCL1 n=1 Tax=Lithospermum erythrorhizon TaxID=34254 RepID=A0AAV3P2C2_LITER
MSSSVVNYACEKNNSSNEDESDRLDLLNVPALHLPVEAILKAAMDAKDKVVKETWKEAEKNDSIGVDTTVSTGLLGTAFTCFRSYVATGNITDLWLCMDIVDACAAMSRLTTRNVTFLNGKGGIYALGAVAAKYLGDQQRCTSYLGLFLELAQEEALPVGPEEGGLGMSYELLYGRAGFLWAALFINKHFGADAVPNNVLAPVVDAILAGGRAGACVTACPLMYRWHGTSYWGAAHGLAGILHVLLHFPLSIGDMEDVKETLRYMISNRFPHSGNYPVSVGNPRDKLVQWSHGATGIGITLCKAAEVFPNDRELRDAAIEAGEVVWKSGLVGKVGLADGIAGNTYAFLSLYHLTDDKIYEERARAFASILYHNAGKIMANESSDPRDHDYSLFHGLAGAACLWFDLLAPERSRFPGYEI